MVNLLLSTERKHAGVRHHISVRWEHSYLQKHHTCVVPNAQKISQARYVTLLRLFDMIMWLTNIGKI